MKVFIRVVGGKGAGQIFEVDDPEDGAIVLLPYRIHNRPLHESYIGTPPPNVSLIYEGRAEYQFLKVRWSDGEDWYATPPGWSARDTWNELWRDYYMPSD